MRSRFAALLVAAVLGGCSETSAPSTEYGLVHEDDEWSAWSHSSRCDFPAPPAAALRRVVNAPALETYCTSFWVTQGQPKTFEIRYAAPLESNGGVEDDDKEDGTGTPGEVFLRLRIPEDARLVDLAGRPVPMGTRVLMTVAVHPSLFVVQFGPHGCGFDGKRPAVLTLNYGRAALGGRNPADLDVWYQPQAGEPWTAEPTTVDLNGNFVRVDLQHFSNYAVAW